jgi:hypothetical protein
MNYETIKNIPRSRDGKMIVGIICAVMCKLFLEKALQTMPENAGDALMAFSIAALMLFVTVLAILRYDTGRPLFEPFKR